jgi:hypothetical protein
MTSPYSSHEEISTINLVKHPSYTSLMGRFGGCLCFIMTPFPQLKVVDAGGIFCRPPSFQR